MLPLHDRYGYSPIVARPDYSWPDGRRLAFYVVTNIEVFAFRKGIGSDFAFVKAPQTHRDFAWRDYGNRVGVWRIFRMLDALGLPAAHNANSLLYGSCPKIFERIRVRGDEIIGHGRANAEHQRNLLWEHDEACLIREATEAITAQEGRRPEGWLGPGPESSVSPDLLQEAGYRYLMNWAADDQPFWMDTRSGKILAMPYPAEVNDAYALAHRQQGAREFADMIVDQFDEMIRQCVGRPLVCPIALHTFIAGQPFRLRPIRKALEHCLRHKHRDRVWFTRPGEITAYCCSLPPGVIPGS
ncbi:MAG: polysaccharide deacetylase [Betaproteobacteria bacterium]|nr:polysaccharide deacetylase [Betaproteobacteria bacterium]